MTSRPGVLDLELLAAAEALTSMRHSLRSWLRGFGLDEETVGELALVCTEVCTNAIEHGYAEVGGSGPIHMTGTAVDGVLRLEVRDHGHWREGDPSPGRGNGLRVVRALMDHVTIRRGDDGTDVVMYRWLENAMRLASGAHS